MWKKSPLATISAFCMQRGPSDCLPIVIANYWYYTSFCDNVPLFAALFGSAIECILKKKDILNVPCKIRLVACLLFLLVMVWSFFKNTPDIESIGEVDPSLVRLLLNLDRLGDARPQNGAINFKHALQEIGFEKPPKTLEQLLKPWKLIPSVVLIQSPQNKSSQNCLCQRQAAISGGRKMAIWGVFKACPVSN